MNSEKFIQPKNVEIDGRKFVISQIPSLEALMISNAVSKAIADNGIYGITMLPTQIDRQILGYTALFEGGVKIVPDTDQLFNEIFRGRVGDAKKLVVKMVKENFGFLTNGDLLNELADQGEAVESAS